MSPGVLCKKPARAIAACVLGEEKEPEQGTQPPPGEAAATHRLRVREREER